MANFNVGEPVFDQGQGGNFGEPVIDPRTGDLVEVVPEDKYEQRVSASKIITYDADDTANAAFFRANTRSQEVIRDRSQGLQDHEILFANNVTLDAAIGEITDAIRRAPGIQAVTDVRPTEYDPVTREIELTYRARKDGGTSVVSALKVGG